MEQNFLVILIFPEFQANLTTYTQNLRMKFWKMSVPFAPQPEISGIFCGMESTLCITALNTQAIMTIVKQIRNLK